MNKFDIIKDFSIFNIPIFKVILVEKDSLLKNSIISYIKVYKIFNITFYKTNEKIMIKHNKKLDNLIDNIDEDKKIIGIKIFGCKKA